MVKFKLFQKFKNVNIPVTTTYINTLLGFKLAILFGYKTVIIDNDIDTSIGYFILY